MNFTGVFLCPVCPVPQALNKLALFLCRRQWTAPVIIKTKQPSQMRQLFLLP
ncbi:hypothetical protein SAMN05444266_107342 [Chitinophaga jiangningensis]|uniref:Uncharacterized protein n=1 Tax=Chitinophaga jiangningensis TaxID=1419482 RepID=A0A1M7HR84_9BACT|nr:hypothetical protein SAMN05444266_107342 [Chitinophaga jiangningensis]